MMELFPSYPHLFHTDRSQAGRRKRDDCIERDGVEYSG